MNNHVNNTSEFVYSTDSASMRGIVPCYVSHLRRDQLERFFPNAKGVTQECDLDSIPSGVGSVAISELQALFPKFLRSLSAEEYVRLFELVANRYHGKPGHKVRTTRIIRDLLVKHGVDLAPGTDSNKRYEKWLAGHVARFQCPSLEYHIRWDVEAFDALGSVQDVDSDGRSCYNPKGCWRDAPVALAAGFDGTAATFVIFVGDKKETLARCWGYLGNDGIVFLSNGYFAESGIMRSMMVFQNAVNAAAGTDFDSRNYDTVCEDRLVPVYANGDGLLCWKKYKDAPDDSVLRSLDFSRHNDMRCRSCGGTHTHSHGFTHMYCEKCVYGENYRQCKRCGTHTYMEADSNHTNCCDMWLCAACMEITHDHCTRCHESLCVYTSSRQLLDYPRSSAGIVCVQCYLEQAKKCAECSQKEQGACRDCRHHCRSSVPTYFCCLCLGIVTEDNAYHCEECEGVFCEDCFGRDHAMCDECGTDICGLHNVSHHGDRGLCDDCSSADIQDILASIENQ